MHAWLCEDPTGVDALNWKELPTPEPRAGEVLLEIHAASLNFPDLLIVQNKYQMKPALPFVPGSEYAGIVVAVGEGVTHLKVGQAVACLSGTGGFATHTIAPAAMCMPLPAGFPMVDAAAFIMTYATSHHALLDRGQLKAGETVLILGAAGGVGTAAIQIAKAAGAKVIAADNTGKEAILATLKPGDHIGEMSLIDDQAHSATVKAEVVTDVLVLGRQQFLQILPENSAMAFGIMRVLVKRLRDADRRIESLALLDVGSRVVLALREMGIEDESGTTTIKVKVSRQTIAQIVGASREMVGRVIKGLEDRGQLIENADGTTILKQETAGLD